jgi:flagellar M-ring protein FliF
MADTATAASPFSGAAFNRLDNRGKLLAMAGIALMVAFLIGGLLWLREPAYAVLFSIQDEKDGGQIVAELQRQNIPYRFSDDGHTILVPQTVVHDTRLRLAAAGLPKGGLVGFELLENQKLGISQFAEQINYQRGLEGELARTIQSLSPVQSTRVHLAIPKPSVFVRDQEKPSASVLLNLYPGKTLDESQVTAIANLVSSSVPDLLVKNVTIVDQNGNLLSQPIDGLLASGMNPGQLKYLQETEKNYIKRIEDILTPVVGTNNVRAQVTADLDFSQVENTSETYKPNQPPNSAAVRSQQVSETSSTSEQKASGVPGSLSNQPPAPVSAPVAEPPNAATSAAKPSSTSGNTANMQRDSTTNYEVDKTIQHVKNQVGGIRRLSVAVVVNYEKTIDPKKKTTTYKPLPPNEIKQITDLVKDTMGFDATRGDTLNVVNTAFTAPEVETVPPLPWYKQPEVISLATLIGRNLAIAGVVLYLILGIIRPALRNIKLDAAAMAEARAAAAAEQQHHAPLVSTHDEEAAEAAKNLARQNPQLVANVIKGWVSGNE